MKHSLFCFFAVSLLTVCVGAASAAPAGHLVIVSIDGLRPIDYSRSDASLVKMPVLRAMAKSGCASTGMVTEFPSITYPNHTTMVTGQPPAIHGIFVNAPLDPFGFSPDRNEMANQIRVPTLWEFVKDHGGTTGNISWPVTLGARIDYSLPSREAFGLGTPGLLAEVEARSWPMTPAKVNDDEWRTRAAITVFSHYKPTLLLVHLVESDESQHEHAPGSPEANRTIEKLDGLVGSLRQQVEKAAGSDPVTWMIVSDHGFQPYDHFFHPLVLLNSLGYVTYNDKQKVTDWRIEMRNGGGMAALVARDPNEHEAIDAVTAHIRFLAAQPQFGIRRLYSREDLSKMGSFPDAFLAFDMKEGFAVGDAWQGPMVTDRDRPYGAHGYDPENPNMRASFILSGAHVAACGTLAPGRLADVAPTAAAILGLEFPPTTGHVHTEALAK